jgi:uncharacterized protein
LSIYLDASVISGLFIEQDALADRARAIVFDDDEVLVVSDFTAAEFASVVAHLLRMNQLTVEDAREAFETFDTWRDQLTDSEPIDPADIRVAAAIIRRLDLNVRAPDAINLAIAQRLRASIATFDRRLADNAHALGVAITAV